MPWPGRARRRSQRAATILTPNRSNSTGCCRRSISCLQAGVRSHDGKVLDQPAGVWADDEPQAAGCLAGMVWPMKAPKKPVSLIYSVEESPPPLVTIFNGVQHVGIIAINLVYPLLIFRAAGAPVDVITDLLAVGMFVLAVGTFLQA